MLYTVQDVANKRIGHIKNFMLQPGDVKTRMNLKALADLRERFSDIQALGKSPSIDALNAILLRPGDAHGWGTILTAHIPLSLICNNCHNEVEAAIAIDCDHYNSYWCKECLREVAYLIEEIEEQADV